jgi:uncharacterized HAD superfamily protein
MVKLLITDIDGTIAKDGWRYRYTDYDERNRQAAYDDSDRTFVLLLSSLAKASWLTVCVTSRNERWQQLTQKWLLKQGVDYANIYMRDDDDYSSAPEFKVLAVKQILETIQPVTLLLIDSREDVIAAYKSEGWSTLQS